MLNLSACILTKDNETCIEKCLKSLKLLDCEIIVLDTGSTDHTLEICRKYTSNVYCTTFQNDFSKVRNKCIKYATKEWILIIDSDEYVPDESIPKIKEAIGEGQPYGGYAISIVNIMKGRKDNNTIYTRLFRNHPDFQFEGKLHEQIMPSIIKIYGEESVILINLEIYHDGYDQTEEELQRKTDRNIKILESFDEAQKDGYYYFNLGNEYLRNADIRLAKKYYNQAYKQVTRWDWGYATSLSLNMIICLYQLEEYKELMEKCNEILGRYPEFHCLYLLRGITYIKYGQYREALEDIKLYFLYKSNINYPFVQIEESLRLNQLIPALINKVGM